MVSDRESDENDKLFKSPRQRKYKTYIDLVGNAKVQNVKIILQHHLKELKALSSQRLRRGKKEGRIIINYYKYLKKIGRFHIIRNRPIFFFFSLNLAILSQTKT